ncbi:lysophospholipase L1-like esterase [Lachnotalea glycerini]|nr:GDSL-type esterase/lipase family protein [Lachnotalea glycerini]PXV95691.1 lysophospholipase L1-like esterase [Lachnotalea glycerini]
MITQKIKFNTILKGMTIFLFIFFMIQNTMPVVYAATTTTKIMPLGDSITDCDFWRTLLFNKLTVNGYDVKFVGSQGTHEGHSGMLVTDLAATTNLTDWLSASNPDIVMMHFGTNDCWSNKGTEAILDAYTVLVAQMRANNPNMKIVVAQIIPLHPNDDADYIARVKDLNSSMLSWSRDLSTSESPITLVNQYSGFDTSTDTYDGVHPNNSGSQKMCDKWYETLAALLAISPTTPSSTASDLDGTLQLTTETNAWSTGSTINLYIKNTSNAKVSGWKLIINKSDITISNIWGGVLTESDDTYMITPLSWNQVIDAGGTINLGIQTTGIPEANFSYTLE